MRSTRLAAAVLALMMTASSAAVYAGAEEIGTPDAPAAVAAEAEQFVTENEITDDDVVYPVVKDFDAFTLRFDADNSPAKPVFTSATLASNGATFKWNRVQGVDGYLLYRYNQTGGYQHFILSADTTSFLWENFDADYTYAILSYINVDGDTLKSEPSEIRGTDIQRSGNQPVPSTQAPAVPVHIRTGRGKTAIRVYWGAIQCAGVEMWIRKDNENWRLVGTVTDGTTNCRAGGLQQGTRYQFRLRSYNVDANGNKYYSNYNDSIYIYTLGTAPSSSSKPAQMAITGCNKGATALRPKWNAISCTGYELYIYKNGSWQYVATLDGSANNYRISGLAPSTTYYITMRAFNKNAATGQTVYGDWAANYKVTTKAKKQTQTVQAPDKVNITRIGKGKTAVRLYWQTQSVDGYEVYEVINGSPVLKATAAGNADNCRLEGLAPNTRHYYQVRAFRNNTNGTKVYGPYSDTKSVTTKADSTPSNNGPKIEKKNGLYYVNGIAVVNKSYAADQNYKPVSTNNSWGLTNETWTAFQNLRSAASRAGYNFWCVSGYRSYWTQNSLYNSYVNRDGRAAADRYSARPGHSEHHTGLCLDVNNASSSFNNTREAQWLAQHCAEYGFIIRYPQGKESKTGYMYESWHIRYVGTDLAKTLTNSGLTLEEYLGIDSYYH